MSAPSSATEPSGGPHDRAANRITGLAVAAFAAALWLWLIPWQVDTVSTGWVRPRTLPNICAWGLFLGGLTLALFPGGVTDLHPRRSLKAAALLALLAIALWALSRWGFLAVMPVLAAVLVAVLRERRPVWIAAAVIAVPGAIWLAVVELLGRSLP